MELNMQVGPQIPDTANAQGASNAAADERGGKAKRVKKTDGPVRRKDGTYAPAAYPIHAGMTRQDS